jgi:hypothetical protein
MNTSARLAIVSAGAMLVLLFSSCTRRANEPAAKGEKKHSASPTARPVVHVPIATSTAPAATPADDAKVADQRAFAPPFPQRQNPFVQPDKGTVHVVAQLRRREDDAQIQLKGFVTVDRPKALLRIGGRVWAAQEGDARDGVAVVRILPPAVTLQRDGVQWDVSLRKPG